MGTTITNPSNWVSVEQLNYFEGKLAVKYQGKAIEITGLTAETVEGALAELLTKINNIASTVYKPAGNIAASGLTSSLLVAANVGKVYNLTDEATTTSDWTEGAGQTIAAGTDVGIVAVEDDGQTSYKFNAYSVKIDLSGYKTINSLKSKGAANKGVYFDSDGNAQAMTYELNKSVPSDAVFTDTTYSDFVGSGANHAAGLVPDPGATAGTAKFLREDGTWATPPDTTYTGGNGIDITNNEVSIDLNAANGLSINNSTKKLEMALASPSSSGVGGSAGAMSAAQAEKLNGLTKASNSDIDEIFA